MTAWFGCTVRRPQLLQSNPAPLGSKKGGSHHFWTCPMAETEEGSMTPQKKNSGRSAGISLWVSV
jgi:hypothetical protein